MLGKRQVETAPTLKNKMFRKQSVSKMLVWAICVLLALFGLCVCVRYLILYPVYIPFRSFAGKTSWYLNFSTMSSHFNSRNAAASREENRKQTEHGGTESVVWAHVACHLAEHQLTETQPMTIIL